MNFSQRSHTLELLDGDDIPFADIRQNMVELDFINRWLGGHKITIDGFKNLVGKGKQVSVCEVGCGGGDNLLSIQRWCDRKDLKATMTGIDIKQECIDFAKSRGGFTNNVNWITSDYRTVIFESKPDIIFSSLFCHHFREAALTEQLRWMQENSRVGFFINDLHRNPIAYHSIKILTRLFSHSYLVKNDAPLSVARGFVRNELESLCKAAGIGDARIYWKWAFRYLLIYRHGRSGNV